MPLLEIENLVVEFHGRNGITRAVDGLSLRISEGETLALVGESGCGKSVSALSILRLLQEPAGRIVSGRISFEGQDLARLSEREMRAIRGRHIAMIFQEPMTSLNPALTIGEQIGEIVRLHEAASAAIARDRAHDMLALVQIPEPARRLAQYPHELSGGMRQRVMIAMALVCNPRLLIADEPTTALDVTIQAQILDILRDLAARLGMATLLITHDLGVVAEMAERVAVMYAGRKVEEGAVAAVLEAPAHPYTVGLLGALPKLGSSLTGPSRRLAEIPGTVPLMRKTASTCSFAPRCSRADSTCAGPPPALTVVTDGHVAACWQASRIRGAA